MTTGFTVCIIMLPILFVIFLAMIGCVFFDIMDGLEWGLFCFGCLGVIGVVVGGLVGLYPYNMAYHSWHVKQGTVSHISSRLLSAGDGGGSDQKYVVQFAGNNQPYGVNDTRASLIHVGDHLKITCVKTHQWGGGVDGYDCRWDQ